MHPTRDKVRKIRTFDEEQLNSCPVTPQSNDTHGQRHTGEPGPRALQPTLAVHVLLDALAINDLLSLLGLDDNQILILLRGRGGGGLQFLGSTQAEVLDNHLAPANHALLPVVQKVHAERADRRGEDHPYQVGMLLAPGRDGPGKQDARIGQIGQVQRVLAGAALDFLEGAGGMGGRGEEFQGWDGDCGH